MPPSGDTWLHVGPPGKRRDWRPAIDRCRTVQGPVFASLSVPGTIGRHAVTREVRLWHGSRRIEFGIGLDTAQRRQRHLLHPLPDRHSGNVAAGNPFGVESRDHLAAEPFRGESFCTGFPEGYDATRWTDVSSADVRLHLHLPARHAHRLCLQEAATRRSSSSSTASCRCRRTLSAGWRRRSMAAGDISGGAPCAASRNVGRRQIVPPRVGVHVPLVAWSPGAGLGRGGASSLPESIGPIAPARMLRCPTGLRPHAAESLVEVSPANVVLSAMRLAQPAKPGDTPPLELRLYESAGQAADVVVRLIARRLRRSRRISSASRLPMQSGRKSSAMTSASTWSRGRSSPSGLARRRPPEPNQRTTP